MSSNGIPFIKFDDNIEVDKIKSKNGINEPLVIDLERSNSSRSQIRHNTNFLILEQGLTDMGNDLKSSLL